MSMAKLGPVSTENINILHVIDLCYAIRLDWIGNFTLFYLDLTHCSCHLRD